MSLLELELFLGGLLEGGGLLAEAREAPEEEGRLGALILGDGEGRAGAERSADEELGLPLPGCESCEDEEEGRDSEEGLLLLEGF